MSVFYALRLLAGTIGILCTTLSVRKICRPVGGTADIILCKEIAVLIADGENQGFDAFGQFACTEGAISFVEQTHTNLTVF